MMTLTNNTTASQCANIWQHLLSGKAITRLDSLSLFGCVNLPGRIYDLKRRYDMPDIPAISTGKVCVTNRYGKTVRVARYTLNPEFLEKIFGTTKEACVSMGADNAAFVVAEGKMQEIKKRAQGGDINKKLNCPDCGNSLIEKWSGVKCSKCEYWECTLK